MGQSKKHQTRNNNERIRTELLNPIIRNHADKHGYATLNDEKRISLKRLLVVPKTSKTIRYGNRNEEEKEGIGAKRVKREGIESNFSFKKKGGHHAIIH